MTLPFWRHRRSVQAAGELDVDDSRSIGDGSPVGAVDGESHPFTSLIATLASVLPVLSPGVKDYLLDLPFGRKSVIVI
jgi:hypothetical protein